jgi:hypothetical protein
MQLTAGWSTEEETELSLFLCAAIKALVDVANQGGERRSSTSPETNRPAHPSRKAYEGWARQRLFCRRKAAPSARASGLLEEKSRDLLASVGHDEEDLLARIYDHCIDIKGACRRDKAR